MHNIRLVYKVRGTISAPLLQYLPIVCIYYCMLKHLRSFVLLIQNANRKVSTLVYSEEGFSAYDVINIECIWESVHLWRNIFAICNKSSILELA